MLRNILGIEVKVKILLMYNILIVDNYKSFLIDKSNNVCISEGALTSLQSQETKCQLCHYF